MANRGAKCSDENDLSYTPWDEVKTEIIYYFTDNGEKAYCLSLDDIKNNYDTRNEYIRMNEQVRRKLFLLPHINVMVDDSFIHGILKLSNVFYVYPRYRAIPEAKENEILIYTAVPVSTNVFMNTELSEIRNRLRGIIDTTIISYNEYRDIKNFLFPMADVVGNGWEQGDDGWERDELDGENVEDEDNMEDFVRRVLENEIVRAVVGNNFDRFTELMNAGEIDPAVEHNYALREAIQLNRKDMVRMLLEDERVIQTIDPRDILVSTFRVMDPELFQIVLDRVEPPNEILADVMVYERLDLLEILLRDDRIVIDPIRTLDVAIEVGNNEIVNLLLNDERIELNVDHLIRAIRNDVGIEIIRTLLEDGRIDPSENDNEALIIASARGDVDTVRLLLTDPRVDPSARNNEALNTPFNAIIELITNHRRYRPN